MLTIKPLVLKPILSDHLPVCIIISSTEKLVENKLTYVRKRVITDDAMERFNQVLTRNQSG